MVYKFTIVSQIFNEEYLLPFWLEHHSQIVDHGIIIDYCSTDRSLEIINKICPNWTVVKTKNLKDDGKPNLESSLINIEINEIEATIEGYKICLNVTEFLIINKEKEEFINSLQKNKYCIEIFSAMTEKHNNYPKNTQEFFNDINLICKEDKFRILNSDAGNFETKTNTSDFYILMCQYYPCNEKVFERLLQIQNCENFLTYNKSLRHHIDNNIYNLKYDSIQFSIEKLKRNNIYYTELIVDSKWGEDKILLENDVNLLKNTDFDDIGYKIFDIENFNVFLQQLLTNEIKKITQKNIKLSNYHNEITDFEHTLILNSMPYKKNSSFELRQFSEYIETFISKILGEPIKIFNEDLWFRICRPSSVCSNDFNPCHRDVYLDFYKNIVNIYLPVIGSNKNSSLKLQPGSHKWTEKETMVTQGGAFFKHTNKKYSVDAIVASKTQLDMVRPNPNIQQMMLFSPYLIHGCADNDNTNETRISLEVRFIRNDAQGLKQEDMFNEFLKIRNWR